MRVGLLVAWILPLVGTGCLGDDGVSGPDLPGDETDGAALSLEIENDLDDCVDVIGALLVTPEQGQKSLPPGFRTRDASALTGSPAPTGRTSVHAETLRCAHGGIEDGPALFGGVYIFIEAPRIAGLDLPAADFDFYEVIRYTEGNKELALLDSIGFGVAGASVTATPTPIVNGNMGLARVADDQGDVFRLESVNPATQMAAGGTIRTWQVTAAGVAYFAYDAKPAEEDIGTVNSCTIRSGSPAHNAFGATNCSGVQSVAILFPNVDLESTFHYLPGAKIQA